MDVSDYNIEQVYSDAFKSEEPMQAPSEGPLAEIMNPRQPFLDLKIGEENKQLTKDEVTQAMQDYYSNKPKFESLQSEYEKFNSQKSEFENQKKDYEKIWDKYKQIDDYARSNPQWLNYMNKQYQETLNRQELEYDPNNPTTGMIQNLQHKVSQLQEQLQSQTQNFTQEKEKQEDSQLDQEINGYKEKYSSFDWNTKDKDGLTLEDKILEHGIKLGVKQFGPAANNYLFDKILKMNEEKAKFESVRKMQFNNKLGIGPITSKPMLNNNERNINTKNMTYNDIERFIVDNLTQKG